MEFYLEILSPERQFFSGNAEMIVFPAIDGLHGVLPRHEPMVTALSAGEMKFKVDGEWRYAAVGDGFVEIMPEYVILLADTVELPEEIDVTRAKAAKERAEERLRPAQEPDRVLSDAGGIVARHGAPEGDKAPVS